MTRFYPVEKTCPQPFRSKNWLVGGLLASVVAAGAGVSVGSVSATTVEGGTARGVGVSVGTAVFPQQANTIVLQPRIRHYPVPTAITREPIQKRLAWLPLGVEAPSEFVGAELPAIRYWFEPHEPIVPIRRPLHWLMAQGPNLFPVVELRSYGLSVGAVIARSPTSAPARSVGIGIGTVQATTKSTVVARGVGLSLGVVAVRAAGDSDAAGVGLSLGTVIVTTPETIRVASIGFGLGAVAQAPTVITFVRSRAPATVTLSGQREATLTQPGARAAAFLTTGGDEIP